MAELAVIEEGATFSEGELLEKTVLQYLPGTVSVVLQRLRKEPYDIFGAAHEYLRQYKLPKESARALANMVHWYLIKDGAYEVLGERRKVLGWQANGIAVDKVVDGIISQYEDYLLSHDVV